MVAPVVVTLPAGANISRASSTCLDKPSSYDEQGRLSVSCWSSINYGEYADFDPNRAAEQAQELIDRMK